MPHTLPSGNSYKRELQHSNNSWNEFSNSATTPQTRCAIFAKPGLKINIAQMSDDNNIEFLSIVCGNISVSSIYKPPKQSFVSPNLPAITRDKIVIGDFNSHSTTWGYPTTKEDGERVETWAENNSLNLIHDSKLPPSFNSGRWKRGYNPDLIFVSSNIATLCKKSVLSPIPHTQHRPLVLQINPTIVPMTVPFRRRFNFNKANWTGFSVDLDSKIESIAPVPDNYYHFVTLVKTISRKHIPRGCRTNYIPGLSKDHKKLLDSYTKSYSQDPFSEKTIELGNELSRGISESRKETCQATIREIDMKFSSRKAWQTIRKLGNEKQAAPIKPSVSAKQFAHHLILSGKTNNTVKKQKNKKILRNVNFETDLYSKSFSLQEVNNAIQSIKMHKAAGLDDIRNEQIVNFGLKTKEWLLALFNNCIRLNSIPALWKKALVVAIPKPGKSPTEPKNFRPISLLCCLYKIFERALLNRLSPILDPELIPEQAGFRPGKTCTGQVLKLTQFIEDGFENRYATGVVLVDLTAAYDTINHKILLKKVYDLTRDYGLVKILRLLLLYRSFKVNLGDETCGWKKQKNGLPQGSVLAPLLFNIYVNDQPISPNTRSFIYADDLAVASQDVDIDRVEVHINNALQTLSTYYSRNRLKPNPEKTVSCLFHLRNRDANRTLKLQWLGRDIAHHDAPVYLGVTLDRSLTYKQHIHKTCLKVASRNNLLQKLSGTNWGAHPHTLRTTALAICYSAAEYAAPVWARSNHTHKLDRILNQTCRQVTGCLKPTPISSLYVLSGIAPPSIRRTVASMAEKKKQDIDPRHPLYGHEVPPRRLKSRNSFLNSVEPLTNTACSTRLELWRSYPSDQRTTNMGITPAECLPPGHNEWVTWKALNRLRTLTGKCKANMVRWGYASGSDLCDCGSPQTMEHLLQCPNLDNVCTTEDLALATTTALECARAWCTI